MGKQLKRNVVLVGNQHFPLVKLMITKVIEERVMEEMKRRVMRRWRLLSQQENNHTKDKNLTEHCIV